MSKRIFAGTVLKVQAGAMLAAAILGAAGHAPDARASNVYVADTTLSLTDPNAFVNAIPPAPGVDTVVFGGLLNGAINASYVWSVGTASTDTFWAGLAVVNPGGDITIADAANSLALGGGGIDLSAATANLTLNAGLTLTTNQTWNVAAARTLTVGGTVAGAASLTVSGNGNTAITGALQCGTMTLSKFGLGTLTLSTQNTYTGITTVGNQANSAGTLLLDFSGPNAPASQIVSASTTFTVSNAAIEVQGNANFAVAQTLFGMTAVWGLTTVSVPAPGLGVTVNLGTPTKQNYNQGASVRILPSANATLSTFLATNAAAGTNNGLVESGNIQAASKAGPYMTYGYSDFAGVTSGVIGAMTYTSQGDGSSITTTINGRVYDILNGVTGTVTCGSYFVEGLRFTGAGAKTFSLTGGSLILGSILVTPSVGTDTVTIGSTGGTIRTGMQFGSRDLAEQYPGEFNSQRPFGREARNTGSLVKNGAGTLVLATTSNSLNGLMFVNEGMIQINAANALGTVDGTAIVLEGGGLSVNGTFTNANANAQHPIRMAGNGGILQVQAGNTFTIASSSNTAITGSSLLTKTGAGTLALANAASTWSGGLVLADGMVDVPAITGTPLGSGPVNVNGGTLGISGNFAGSNAISVNVGGTITATGTLDLGVHGDRRRHLPREHGNRQRRCDAAAPARPWPARAPPWPRSCCPPEPLSNRVAAWAWAR